MTWFKAQERYGGHFCEKIIQPSHLVIMLRNQCKWLALWLYFQKILGLHTKASCQNGEKWPIMPKNSEKRHIFAGKNSKSCPSNANISVWAGLIIKFTNDTALWTSVLQSESKNFKITATHFQNLSIFSIVWFGKPTQNFDFFAVFWKRSGFLAQIIAFIPKCG